MYKNYQSYKIYADLKEKLNLISELVSKANEEIDSVYKNISDGYKVDNGTLENISKLKDNLTEIKNRINKVILVEVEKEIKMSR